MAFLNKPAFNNALTLLSGLLPSRPIKPIFGAALLTPLDETHLEITVSDPHFYARAVIEGKITDFPEAIGVLPKFLRELLSALPGDTVEIGVNPGRTEITVGYERFRATVKGLSSADFLPVSTTPLADEKTFWLEPGVVSSIAKVLPAALDDSDGVAQGKRGLTRVKADLSAGKLRLIATDGYRMSIVHVPATGADLSATLSQDVLTLLVRSAKVVAPDSIRVHAGEQAGFVMGGAGQIQTLEYYAKNDTQPYPNIESFLGLHKTYSTLSLVSGSDLRRCVQQAGTFGSQTVKLRAQPDGLAVTAAGEDGDTTTVLEATFALPAGNFVEVSCSPEYLRGALSTAPGAGVMLGIRDPLKPIVLFPPVANQEPEEIHIVMPMYPQRT